MRRLLLIFIWLLLPALALAKPLGIPSAARPKSFVEAVMHPFAYYFFGTCGNGYSVGPIQVKLQKAVNTDQSNFVYGGVITDARFKSAANGGPIQNSAANAMSITGPADFVVCDASSSGNLLSFDIPRWDAVNGVVELHFLQATLHTASSDSIYIFVNNAGVVTSQQDSGLGTASNFYSTAGYSEVCHFPDSSTLNVKCSLSAGTVANHSAGATTGIIDGASTYVAASSQYIDLGASINPTNMTIEAWIRPTSLIGFQNLFSNIPGTFAGGYNWYLGDGGANGRMVWQPASGGTLRQIVFLASDATAGVWDSYAATQTGTTVTTWHNGVGIASSGTPIARGATTQFGNLGRYGAGASNYLDAAMDEFRISSSVRTADYFYTVYNMQATPAFQIVGTTYSTPTVVNMAQCSWNNFGSNGTPVCTTPFDLTAGGVLVATFAYVNPITGDCNTHALTSSAGNTFTLQQQGHFTGSLQNYYTCIYTAPITSTGAETVTAYSVETGSLTVREIKSVTTSGMVSTNSSTSPPATMTLTAPGANSFLLCSTHDDNPSQVTSVTGGLTLFRGQMGLEQSGHPSLDTNGYALVASGSQSCTFSGTSEAGAMIILANSPAASATVRHRVVN